jgi:hypothetical protein
MTMSAATVLRVGYLPNTSLAGIAVVKEAGTRMKIPP